ncbi:hypothetical protein EV182_006315 [Spiromyces aspiralis]|uniref:Uncharacterized protein n=1 Tax=Spiromyces aspiralis TaxID=68401 RepID=A0ACC1H9G0_9FUNG|nr:hypothetical protein EV182_006315 [Spiromyces aspiralis]
MSPESLDPSSLAGQATNPGGIFENIAKVMPSDSGLGATSQPPGAMNGTVSSHTGYATATPQQRHSTLATPHEQGGSDFQGASATTYSYTATSSASADRSIHAHYSNAVPMSTSATPQPPHSGTDPNARGGVNGGEFDSLGNTYHHPHHNHHSLSASSGIAHSLTASLADPTGYSSIAQQSHQGPHLYSLPRIHDASDGSVATTPGVINGVGGAMGFGSQHTATDPSSGAMAGSGIGGTSSSSSSTVHERLPSLQSISRGYNASPIPAKYEGVGYDVAATVDVKSKITTAGSAAGAGVQMPSHDDNRSPSSVVRSHQQPVAAATDSGNKS